MSDLSHHDGLLDRIEELESEAENQTAELLDAGYEILAHAERAEAAEAKLATAMKFTESVVRYAGNNGDDYLADKARATLKELKGENDD